MKNPPSISLGITVATHTVIFNSTREVLISMSCLKCSPVAILNIPLSVANGIAFAYYWYHRWSVCRPPHKHHENQVNRISSHLCPRWLTKWNSDRVLPPLPLISHLMSLGLFFHTREADSNHNGPLFTFSMEEKRVLHTRAPHDVNVMLLSVGDVRSAPIRKRFVAVGCSVGFACSNEEQLQLPILAINLRRCGFWINLFLFGKCGHWLLEATNWRSMGFTECWNNFFVTT